MAEPLAILFEDPHCLVVAKPAGVPTQRGMIPGEETVESAVRRHLAGDDPASVYLGTVHRLDKPVSGVLLWAKTPKAARRLADQFASREAKKEYWAVAVGIVPAEEGTWDDWLCVENTGLGTTQVVRSDTPRARRAITRYERGLAARMPDDCVWLKLRPETGRTHQLRAQSASRNLAILGDRAYGSDRPFPSGIALHARSLTIRHPIRQESMTFEAPPPEHWARAGIELGPA